MVYMHIVYPYDQTAKCQSYTTEDSCSNSGFQILSISHHPCGWHELANNFLYHNCNAVEPNSSTLSILIAAFVVCAISNTISLISEPIFKIAKVSIEELNGNLYLVNKMFVYF